MEVLIEQEVALHHFEVRQNLELVTRLLSPDFMEVGQSGTTFDFKTIRKLMKYEQADDSKVHSQDYDCTKLSARVYLLTYKTASFNGDGRYSHYAKRSSIWVQNGSQWQLQYHQGTPCDPFELSINRSNYLAEQLRA